MSDRTVIEWIRHIQIEWELKPESLASLLHLPLAKVVQYFGPGGETPHEKNEYLQATIPPGLETAAPVIAIYKKLAARYPSSEEQVKWLFTEHPDFGGTKPIDVAASSIENLYWLGYYLDSGAAPNSPPAKND